MNLHKLINTYHFSEGEKIFQTNRQSLIDGVFIQGSKFQIIEKLKDKHINNLKFLKSDSDSYSDQILTNFSDSWPMVFADEVLRIKVTKVSGERILEKKFFIRDLYNFENLRALINIPEILSTLLQLSPQDCKVALFLEPKIDEIDISPYFDKIVLKFYDTFVINFGKKEYSKFNQNILKTFGIDLYFNSSAMVSHKLISIHDPLKVVSVFRYLLAQHNETNTVNELNKLSLSFEESNDLFYLLMASSYIMPSLYHELID